MYISDLKSLRENSIRANREQKDERKREFEFLTNEFLWIRFSPNTIFWLRLLSSSSSVWSTYYRMRCPSNCSLENPLVFPPFSTVYAFWESLILILTFSFLQTRRLILLRCQMKEILYTYAYIRPWGDCKSKQKSGPAEGICSRDNYKLNLYKGTHENKATNEDNFVNAGHRLLRMRRGRKN